MMSAAKTQKVAISQCQSCNGLALAHDNFCRWCGIHQDRGQAASAKKEAWQDRMRTVALNGEAEPLLPLETIVLRNDESMSQSLTDQLLNTLKQSVVVKTDSLRLNRFGALVIAVLIAIPMWLLIILLSPFDAYKAARTASSQITWQ